MQLNLPDGASCFLDANIFYYHFVETPPFSQPCSDLLHRVAIGTIRASTSTHLLAEAMHKIMIAELDEFRLAMSEIAAMPLTCFAPDLTALSIAASVAKQVSLLTNDALSVTLMRDHGLTHLVTNDDDFDAVPGITVWKPR